MRKVVSKKEVVHLVKYFNDWNYSFSITTLRQNLGLVKLGWPEFSKSGSQLFHRKKVSGTAPHYIFPQISHTPVLDLVHKKVPTLCDVRHTTEWGWPSVQIMFSSTPIPDISWRTRLVYHIWNVSLVTILTHLSLTLLCFADGSILRVPENYSRGQLPFPDETVLLQNYQEKPTGVYWATSSKSNSLIYSVQTENCRFPCLEPQSPPFWTIVTTKVPSPLIQQGVTEAVGEKMHYVDRKCIRRTQTALGIS